MTRQRSQLKVLDIPTMTLIIGAVKSDGIIISNDGRIVDIRTNEVLNEKEKKVFFLKNTIYIGISGRGFGRDFVAMLVHTLKSNVDFSTPYTLKDVTEKIIVECKKIPSGIADRKGFLLACMIGGYDRDSKNRSLRPFIYAFNSNDYNDITDDVDIFMGANVLKDEWYDQIDSVNTLNALKLVHAQIIKEASVLDPTVGPKAKSALIRP